MLTFKKYIYTSLLICSLSVTALAVNAQKSTRNLMVHENWSKDYQPFCIAGNLYYVGTEDLACYLITTPQGHILINTGLSDSAPLIRQHVEKLGFKFTDIKILLATHAHFDHVGAMAAVKKLTGARMLIGAADAQVLADGGKSDYAFGGKVGTFAPVKADGLLHDHDTVKLGGMNIVALHHPGHTKGACSFLFDVKDAHRSYRVLIANMPSILDETRFPGMPTYPNVGKDYAYTFKAMRQQKFDIWLASHASQFNMAQKHKQGAPYNPSAFMNDRKGYDAILDSFYKTYLSRSSKKS